VKKKQRKDMMKYGKRWNSRMVINHQKREEVMNGRPLLRIKGHLSAVNSYPEDAL